MAENPKAITNKISDYLTPGQFDEATLFEEHWQRFGQ